MSAPVNEFLEFLKRTNEVIRGRNPGIEEFVSMRELMSLIHFLEQCDQSNKFNPHKFNELFNDCRPRFIELLQGGYIWFDELKEENFAT